MTVKVIPTKVFEHDYDLKSEEFEVWDDKDWVASFRYKHDAENFAAMYRRSVTLSKTIDEIAEEYSETMKRLANK